MEMGTIRKKKETVNRIKKAILMLSIGLTLAVSCQVSAAVIYVDQNSPSPQPPYSTRDTAAHYIQDAVAVANNGDSVLVEPGRYDITNRIVITNGISLLSADGANQTIINNKADSWSLWVSNSTAVVDGFTIENTSSQLPIGGAFLTGGTVQNCILTNYVLDTVGVAATVNGGVLSNSLVTYVRLQGSTDSAVYCTNGGIVTHCQLICRGEGSGMGIYLVDSRLKDSLIDGTSGTPGDSQGVAVYAESSVITGCTVTENGSTGQGGGVYLNSSLMDRCVVVDNYCYSQGVGVGGGGIFETNSTIRDTLIEGNSASAPAGDSSGSFGGGVYMQGGTLVNCTVTGNSAQSGSTPGEGGGVYVERGGITNSIIYSNVIGYIPATGSENDWFNAESGVFDHSCTTPDPGGMGNITQDPQFVDPTNDNYHLKSTSPCIDTGIVQPWMAGAEDLDGKPRIVNGTVDMGAYEHPETSLEPVEIMNPQWMNGSFGFSFLTQTNDAYYVEYTYSMAPASWQTLTHFVGDGGMVSVTNQNLVAPTCLYRVVAQ